MTQTPADVDFVEWCAPAAQRMLLRKDHIESLVDKTGRLREFKQDMAGWSKLHNGHGGSVPELSQKLYDICARYELLPLVAAQRSAFSVAVRSSGRSQGSSQGALNAAAAMIPELARAYCGTP